MFYAEYPLPDPCLPWAVCLWRFAVERDDPAQFSHIIPPDGMVSISMSCLPGGGQHGGLTGPSSHAHVVPAVHGMVAAGIRLQPGAAPALLPVAARDLVGQMQPLPSSATNDLLAHALATFAADPEQIDDVAASFMALTVGKPVPDPVVADAAQRIIADPANLRVDRLAGALRISPRQLRRRFLAASGISPKAFAQIYRLRQACIMALSHPVSAWAHIAADAGFADQAHFNRHVARTFGVTPRQLIAYLGSIDHRFASNLQPTRDV
ncbi:helix-turn-helix transcriptional regulator [Blastomonas sp.]|uniref:helix-turn-helix transcriptional regulator n=1 Tax=Blastomonas sp. TaxID=1909299 RepID=UPI0035946E9F